MGAGELEGTLIVGRGEVVEAPIVGRGELEGIPIVGRGEVVEAPIVGRGELEGTPIVGRGEVVGALTVVAGELVDLAISTQEGPVVEALVGAGVIEDSGQLNGAMVELGIFFANGFPDKSITGE